MEEIAMCNRYLLTGIATMIMSFSIIFSASASAVVVGEAPGSENNRTISVVSPPAEESSVQEVPSTANKQEIVKANAIPRNAVIEETTQAKTTQAATSSAGRGVAIMQNGVLQGNTTQTSTAREVIVQTSVAKETITQTSAIRETVAQTSAIRETTTRETIKESTVKETTVKESIARETTVKESTIKESSVKASTIPATTVSTTKESRTSNDGTEKKREIGPGMKLLPTKEETTEAVKEESGNDKIRKELAEYARQFVGLRYRWGGNSLTTGVDCSGLIQQLYKRYGISTGRTSRDQARRGRQVPLSDLKIGDVLVYTKGGYINHVTMYIGNGQLINASSENTGVIISDIGYRTPIKAVRFLDD